MGRKSEFETILDNLLGQKSGERSATFTSQNKIEEEYFKKIEFSFGPLGQKLFGSINRIYPKIESKTKPQEKKEKILEKLKFVKPERSPIIEEPVLRVKRKLSFDQEGALKVFAIFGEKLNEYSTDEEIKMAYRRLAKRFHPDLHGNKGEEFKMISSAYEKFI
jgi:hypothetical protein